MKENFKINPHHVPTQILFDHISPTNPTMVQFPPPPPHTSSTTTRVADELNGQMGYIFKIA